MILRTVCTSLSSGLKTAHFMILIILSRTDRWQNQAGRKDVRNSNRMDLGVVEISLSFRQAPREVFLAMYSSIRCWDRSLESVETSMHLDTDHGAIDFCPNSRGTLLLQDSRCATSERPVQTPKLEVSHLVWKPPSTDNAKEIVLSD